MRDGRIDARPVGMAVFLASWAMMFVALAYAALALEERGAWSSMLPETGAALPAAATALVVASSIALARGHALVAAALGLGFIAVQAAIAGRGFESQVVVGRSVLLLLSGFHAIHAAVGVAGLVAARSKPGMWAVYWHAVALAWLALAGVIYL